MNNEAMKDKATVKRLRRAMSELGCDRIEIAHANGSRSLITNRDAIVVAMNALRKEVELQVDEAKGTHRNDTGTFAILRADGQFFRDFTACIPATLHGFTTDESRAMKFGSYAEAKKAVAQIREKVTDDEGKPFGDGYLCIVKKHWEAVG